MLFTHRVSHRFIRLGVSACLVLGQTAAWVPGAQAGETVPAVGGAEQRFFSQQWAVLVPDAFDGPQAWEKLQAQLVQGGVDPKNLIDLRKDPGYSQGGGVGGSGQRPGAGAGDFERAAGKPGRVRDRARQRRPGRAVDAGAMAREKPGAGARGRGGGHFGAAAGSGLGRLGARPALAAFTPGRRPRAAGPGPASESFQKLSEPQKKAEAALRCGQKFFQDIRETLGWKIPPGIERRLFALDRTKQEVVQKTQVWQRFPEQAPLGREGEDRSRRWTPWPVCWKAAKPWSRAGPGRRGN